MAALRFLIGYSACGITREAFRELGIDAWTCDLLPARDGSPHHLQCDIWEAVRQPWDGALFHPMCTYLTVSAAWAFEDPDYERFPGVGYHQKLRPGTLVGQARREARAAAVENFRRLLALPFPKAIENPNRNFVSRTIRPADQTIHPNHFGDDASKATGLWLDRLPKIRPTGFKAGRITEPDAQDMFGGGTMRWANQTDSGQNALRPSEDRWLRRSETFPGIARAFGQQWGTYLLQQRRAA